MKILIVEDERKLLDLYSKMLSMAGHEITTADNGKSGLEQARSKYFDLIISDVMMPIMNGQEMLRELRQQGNNTHVILLTAMGQEVDKIAGLDLGADEYLVKPISLKELQARVNSLDRRKTEYKPIKITHGNTTLDLNELELKSVNSVSLSNTEMKVLSLLLNNLGKRIKSDTLIKNVWKEETEQDELFLIVSFLQTKLSHIHSNLEILGDLVNGYKAIVKE